MEDIKSWAALNAWIMTTESEEQVAEALEHVFTNRGRGEFLKRLWSRYNRLRTLREKRELQTYIKSKHVSYS